MKIASTKYSDTSFAIAILVLRLGLGILMIPHGFNKLQHFSEYAAKFSDPFHIGKTASLALVIFAEFFCSCLLIAGLFTRLAVIPLIITMAVAVFIAHHGEIFDDGEHGALYLVGYLVILIAGPGKISLDRLIGK